MTYAIYVPTVELVVLIVGASLIYLFIAGGCGSLVYAALEPSTADSDAFWVAVIGALVWPVTLPIVFGVRFARRLARTRIPGARVIDR